MKLWGGEEREVVAAVVNYGLAKHDADPEPHDRQWSPHQQDSGRERSLVSQHMVHRVVVDRHKGEGCCPFMVCLVDMLVEEGDVQQSMGVVEPDVTDDVADKNMAKGGGESGQGAY